MVYCLLHSFKGNNKLKYETLMIISLCHCNGILGIFKMSLTIKKAGK